MGDIISFMRDLPIMTIRDDFFRCNASLFGLSRNLVERQRCFHETGADGKGPYFTRPLG